MKSSGVVSKAEVTRDVRIESFSGRRHVVTALGVKGAVIASKESLVDWDLRAATEALRRTRGEGSSLSVRGPANFASGASDEANRSQRAMDVSSAADNDPAAEDAIVCPRSEASKASNHRRLRGSNATLCADAIESTHSLEF